jgi:hypothetical protein
MELFILPVFIFSFIALPLMCGYTAKSSGFSFWKWFAIGCLLPVAANIILYLVIPVKSVKNR